MVIFGLSLVLLQSRSFLFHVLLRPFLTFFILEMAGPEIPWRPGRIDGFAAQATSVGRFPEATQDVEQVEWAKATRG